MRTLTQIENDLREIYESEPDESVYMSIYGALKNIEDAISAAKNPPVRDEMAELTDFNLGRD